MTIQLKPEQERIIQDEIESGHFRSPDEVLDHALAVFREKSAPGQIEPKRSLEQEWLKQHQAEYAGAWVALKGSNLVARGSSVRQVLDAARSQGYEQPLVVHVPSEPQLPFGGW